MVFLMSFFWGIKKDYYWWKFIKLFYYVSVKNFDKTKTVIFGIYNIAKNIYNGKFFEEENEKFKLSEKMKINLKYFAYN